MPTLNEFTDGEVREAARAQAAVLARARGRSCVLFHDPEIDPRSVIAVAGALLECGPAVDIVLHSPGGCSCCAYAIARELRRNCSEVGVIVPYVAKSAATLVALAADEIVLGALAELGPIDSQASLKQRADVSVRSSCLVSSRALDEVKKFCVATYDEVVRQLIQCRRMRAEDACRAAAELVGHLATPLTSQVDPVAIAESARSLENGAMYAERILRRYRPQLWAERGRRIVEQLVFGYPTHEFTIDLEELLEIGLPARHATGDEAEAVAALAGTMNELDGNRAFIERVDPVPAAALAASSGDPEVDASELA